MNISNKLKPEFKVKLVETLKSGKYEQGKQNLQSSNGKFCCLGVACEILKDEGLVEDHATGGSVSYKAIGELGGSDTYPTEAIYKLMFGDNVKFQKNKASSSVAHVPVPEDYYGHRDLIDETLCVSVLNDSGQYTFDQMADFIEEHL